MAERRGHVIGVKTQNVKSVPAGFLCLKVREEKRRELVRTEGTASGRNKVKLMSNCGSIT